MSQQAVFQNKSSSRTRRHSQKSPTIHQPINPFPSPIILIAQQSRVFFVRRIVSHNQPEQIVNRTVHENKTRRINRSWVYIA